jgi:tetratricopeptide (TPR) repeat protein
VYNLINPRSPSFLTEANVRQLVVDEESAVLGLSGLRETQLKLDADHSQMCKVGARGPMYRLIQGNIKQLVDQALLSEQGFIPQPMAQGTGPTSPPPLPPRIHSNSSTPYQTRPLQSPETITGVVYTPLDNDPRSIRSAEFKNWARWDEARTVEYEIFQEHLRTLGPDHYSTLSVAYNLAEVELESGFMEKSNEWCQWVFENSKRVFGIKHPLSMRIESLIAEVLWQEGKLQEAESVCANVLARQQMTIGEDHIDTCDTRCRLGMTYSALGRREDAIVNSEKLTNTLKRLLGDTHIRVFSSVLDTLQHIISNQGGDANAMIVMRFQPNVQKAVELLQQAHEETQTTLGQSHPFTIRALTLYGQAQSLMQQKVEASETLRRALASSEESLGPDHPITIGIVGHIGVMYATQSPYANGGHRAAESFPWLLRYLDWMERRRGKGNDETQATLELLGNLNFNAQDYEAAQKYYERMVAAARGGDQTRANRIDAQLQLCRANTMYTRRGVGSGLGGLLSNFRY